MRQPESPTVHSKQGSGSFFGVHISFGLFSPKLVQASPKRVGLSVLTTLIMEEWRDQKATREG
jgi:hypothetical protein